MSRPQNDKSFNVSVLGSSRVHRPYKKISLIGSSDSCDIVIDNVTVSGIHAVIEKTPAGLKIFDMNSRNGTYVNDERVISKIIAEGDQIKLGSALLKISLDDIGKDTDSLPPPLKRTGISNIKKITAVDKKEDGLPYIGYPLSSDPSTEYSEYIFEDTNDVYPIFKYYADKLSVEVTSLYDDRVYAVDYLPVSNGTFHVCGRSDSRNALEFPYVGKNEKLPLLVIKNNIVNVVPLPGFHAFKLSNGAFSKIAKHENIILNEGDLLCFVNNKLQFYFRVDARPPKVKSAPVFRRDKELRKYLLLMLILVLLFMTWMTLFTVDKDEQKEKDPERIASILYKRPAVTKSIAKTLNEKKEIIQKVTKKAEEVVDKTPAVQKVSAQKLENKTVVKTSGNPNTKKSDLVKKVDPKQSDKVKLLDKVTEHNKKIEAKVSASKSGSQNKAQLSPSKGHVDTYKAAGLHSSLSNLLSKGGALSKVSASKESSSDLGSNVVSGGAESATFKRAQIKTGIGSLTGVAQGKLDSTRGMEGVVGKKNIYMAGLPDKTVVLGGMDPDTIRKILLDHLPQFRYCYQRVLDRSQEEFSGVVQMNFVIGASGHVTKASAEGVSGTLPTEVRSCVVNVLRGIPFPEPLGGGVVEVNQPMNFYPKTK